MHDSEIIIRRQQIIFMRPAVKNHVSDTEDCKAIQLICCLLYISPVEFYVTREDSEKTASDLQIIFTAVSVFTKENFNPFSNLVSPFGIGTHEIQWLFSIFF